MPWFSDWHKCARAAGLDQHNHRYQPVYTVDHPELYCEKQCCAHCPVHHLDLVGFMSVDGSIKLSLYMDVHSLTMHGQILALCFYFCTHVCYVHLPCCQFDPTRCAAMS